jgi:UDP-N-acetylglucosamine--N-acetylmuramyl-(pentapeptide) pyrophosphoryl-undecaprenol N-acetylglucosamine transferase
MQVEQTTLKRVLIMAGGTGGHVFPGLALAHYLHTQGVEVHWLGTRQGIEARLVPEANIPLHYLSVSGLRGKGIATRLLAPVRIATATMQAMRVLRRIRPDVVVGMGGFASGPGGIASWLLRYPLVIHEQNAKAGLTNKVLARLACRVLEGFPGTFPAQPKVVAVGNPVRVEIESLPNPQQRFKERKAPLRLLVLGGSLGAQALNSLVPSALALLQQEERPEVRHQSGEKHFETAKTDYKTMGISATVTPFIQDMAEAYAWADIVLCRAGALTVAELCAAGLGAILVPFPHAVDDHQTANAHFMADHQAALCIQQKDMTISCLAEHVKSFSLQPEKRLAMAEQSYALRKVHVAEKIFDILSKIN